MKKAIFQEEGDIVAEEAVQEPVKKTRKPRAKKVETTIEVTDEGTMPPPEEESVSLASKGVQDFFANPANIADAYGKATQLFKFVAKGSKIEDSESLTFTRTDCVHRTSLSHSKAQSLLELLVGFKFAEWIVPNKEFKFTLKKSEVLISIIQEIYAAAYIMDANISRYAAACNMNTIGKKEADEPKPITVEEIKKALIDFIETGQLK